MQVCSARWSAKAVAVHDSELPIVKLLAHYFYIHCGTVSSIPCLCSYDFNIKQSYERMIPTDLASNLFDNLNVAGVSQAF